MVFMPETEGFLIARKGPIKVETGEETDGQDVWVYPVKTTIQWSSELDDPMVTETRYPIEQELRRPLIKDQIKKTQDELQAILDPVIEKHPFDLSSTKIKVKAHTLAVAVDAIASALIVIKDLETTINKSTKAQKALELELARAQKGLRKQNRRITSLRNERNKLVSKLLADLP